MLGRATRTNGQQPHTTTKGGRGAGEKKSRRKKPPHLQHQSKRERRNRGKKKTYLEAGRPPFTQKNIGGRQRGEHGKYQNKGTLKKERGL